MHLRRSLPFLALLPLVALAACQDAATTEPDNQPLSSPLFGVVAGYSIIDLGTLGGASGEALDVNDWGQVVGVAMTASGARHAFLWTQQAGMRDLGVLGRDFSEAHAINNAGHVAGVSSPIEPGSRAFLWTEQDGMVSLGTLGGQFSAAYNINDRGQVVGFSSTDVITPKGSSRPFLWTPGKGMINLGALTDGNSFGATGINRLGEAVGTSTTFIGCCTVGLNRATFYSRDGEIIDIGSFPNSDSYATRLNDRGQVVGGAVAFPNEWHAFVWSLESGLNIFGPPGSVARGINNRGQIIGQAGGFPSQHVAVVWQPSGEMVTLPDLPGSSGGSTPHKMNERGQIAGVSTNSSGETRAVLWLPVQSP